MSMSLNRVELIGRLGSDPVISYTGSGKPVCSLSIATNKQWVNPETQEPVKETTWHKVTLFGVPAEVASKLAKKGAKVRVEGELKNKTFTDAQGVVNRISEIEGNVFSSFMLLGGVSKEAV